MKQPCDKCSCTGFIIGMPIPPERITTADPSGILCTTHPCPKCKGEGYFDPEGMVVVPMKEVKEDYWDKL